MNQYEILPAITLEIRFEDLFITQAPIEQRRQRWAAWLKLARADGESGRWVAGSWMDAGECDGCKHKRGRWCDSMGLPCSVNPILSFRHAMPGMACMGAGKELKKVSINETMGQKDS